MMDEMLKKNRHANVDVSTCTLCSCYFKNPKQLACLHNFCEQCLENYITTTSDDMASDGTFPCPVCNFYSSVPFPESPRKHWAKQLRNNNFITSLIEGVSLTNERNTCAPCRRDGKSTIANKWCRDCFEPLCEICKGIHRKIKQISEHQIIPLEEIQMTPANQRISQTKPDETCIDHHGRNIEVFCPEHRQLCCVVCFATKHRECRNIRTIEELASEIKESDEVGSLVDTMTNVLKEVDEQISDKNQMSQILNNKYDQLTEQVETLTKKAIDRLEVLRDQTLDKLKKCHKKETNAMENQTGILQNTKLALELDFKFLEAVAKHGSQTMLFITLEKFRHQIEYQKGILADDRDKTEDVDYNFEFSDSFLEIANKIISLGNLNILRSPLKIGTHDDTEDEMNAGQVHAKDKSRSEMAVESTPSAETIGMPREVQTAGSEYTTRLIKEKDYNGSTPNERRLVWFTGGTFLPDGVHFLLADYNNHKLKTFKREVYNPVMEYSLESAPCDVTVSGPDEVIVSLPHICKLAKYRFLNNVIKQIDVINTSSSPEGVAYADSNIIVSFGDSIKILNAEGKETLKISILESFTYTSPVAVARDNKRFYHRDGESIVCRLLTGEEVFRFQDKALQQPAGLSLDFQDNVYVCDCKSSCIYQISSDGSRGRVIRSSRVCVGSPVGIGFDKDGKRLWLTSNIRRSGQHLTLFYLQC